MIEERQKHVDGLQSKQLSALQSKLKSWANEKNFSLESKTQKMKARDKKAVARGFHGAGIVVPVDKKGVGYRPLPETPGGISHYLSFF